MGLDKMIASNQDMGMNRNALNQIAETHMRAQCSKGHWNLLRLVLDRSMSRQVVAAGQSCVKCKEQMS